MKLAVPANAARCMLDKDARLISNRDVDGPASRRARPPASAWCTSFTRPDSWMIKSFLRLWLAVVLDPGGVGRVAADRPGAPRGGAGSSGAGPGSPGRVRSVALFQHVSQATIEEGARGVLAGLAESGYQEGRTIRVRRYNAEGDAATSNTIARAIVGGDDELVITLSTPSLQAVAGANRDAKRPHVFGMVSDPVAAGVGISRDDPRKHPPYMVGLGTMQPVAETFRMARRLAPRTGEGRGRLEPVGGEFGSLHEDRPDGLQGAGDRAARGERRRLGGRPGGGRLARRPGGRGGLGRGRQHGALLARRRDRPGAGGGRAGLHERPRVRRARGLVRPRGGLSPGRRVDRPAGRPRAGRRVARGHADPLRGPARVLDQPARARGADRGLVLPRRDRRQGRRRGRKGGAGPTPPA